MSPSYVSVSPIEANIPLMERNALQSLYLSTMGNYWTVFSNENSWDFSSNSTNPCLEKWIGITCFNGNISSDFTFHIESIDLSNRNLIGTLPHRNLIGTLPPELCQLSWLRNLKVDNNNLYGKIPLEVNKLNNLQNMELSNNFLSGEIPMLGEMKRLKVLKLGFNLLTSLTNRRNNNYLMSIENLVSLEDLDLCNNPLEGSLGSFKI